MLESQFGPVLELGVGIEGEKDQKHLSRVELRQLKEQLGRDHCTLSQQDDSDLVQNNREMVEEEEVVVPEKVVPVPNSVVLLTMFTELIQQVLGFFEQFGWHRYYSSSACGSIPSFTTCYCYNTLYGLGLRERECFPYRYQDQ